MQIASHLVLRQRAPNEDDYALPLILVLTVLEGQLSDLHRARKVCLALDLQTLDSKTRFQIPNRKAAIGLN